MLALSGNANKFESYETENIFWSIIKSDLKKNNNILKNDPYAEKFGVSIAGEFATLNARVLKPPSIGYSKSEVVTLRAPT